MFSGYDLTLTKSFFKNKEKTYEEYIEKGKKHIKIIKEKYNDDLFKYINKDTLDGSKLQDDWFPKIDADIFISHSHDDEDLANALAGWIYVTFGITVFIDSNVWDYASDLLDDLNEKYSNKRVNPAGGFVYSYKRCNQASQHVNIMLSVALQNMIDNVECVILLNTKNSITLFDNKGGIDNKINTTYSPWIYLEIICTKIVRKKPLLFYRDYKMMPIYESASEQYLLYFSKLKVSYNVSLKHLVEIDDTNLIQWYDEYNEMLLWGDDIIKINNYRKYPLDALYYDTYTTDLSSTYDLFNKIPEQHIEKYKSALEGKQVIYQTLNDELLLENDDDLYCENCDGCSYCPKCDKY